VRAAIAILLVACNGSPKPTAPPLITPPTGVVVGDAAVPSVDAAPAIDPDVTPIMPLAVVGPFKTVLDSCRSARPCGFTEMDSRGRESKPPSRPDCAAVVDPSAGIASRMLPQDMQSRSPEATPKVVHKIAGGEIRLASVRCAVPEGLRYEHAEYYVYVQRSDGWWRTDAPVMTYNYNEKYCGGGMYIRWNDKPTRTIAGIAASFSCLTCSKQGDYEDVLELMLRIETAGVKPLVFAPLPVGARHKQAPFEPPTPDDPDPCPASAFAMSMKETWVSDDEVILDGKGGSGGPLEHIDMAAPPQQGAAAGRYRFIRP
jgi:hypothetical protein